MKRFIFGLMLVAMLCQSAIALGVGQKEVCSNKEILNTTIHTANATTEVALTAGTYIKNITFKPRGAASIKFLNGSATSDAYVTITASQEYTTPIEAELYGDKSFYFMSETVPATLETIYWYK
jgi:hypothetical protein